MKNPFNQELLIEEEVDYSSIPLEKKLVHKNWKIKQRGFEELETHFQTSPPSTIIS